jgi:putative transposase
MTYKSHSRATSDLKAHLVLTTKYRRKVITAPMLQRLREICFNLCQKWGCELLEVNGEEDHLHLLFGFYPQMQLSKFVNNLKTVSSIYIRKEFPDQVKRFYWNKPIFWHSAYFIATCGGVTVEQLKQYVQQQDSPTDDEVLAKGSSRPRRQRGRGGDSRG